MATFAALVLGPVWLAPWMALVAAAAAVQAANSWRHRHRPPAALVAGIGAGVPVLAAAAGPVPALVAGVGMVVLTFLNGLVPGGRHTDPLLTVGIAAAVGLAATSPVLLRGEGLVPALVLFAFAGAHDAAAYVVGSGSATWWEGPAAGMVSIGAVTLAAAAVLVPPFRGASPWLLGVLAAVLAPLGPYAGTALLGERRARVPALRRLDSLLLLGPVWTLAAVLLLD